MSKFINKGLSLIELALVLVIVAIVMVSGLSYLRSRDSEYRNQVTLKKITVISYALADYIHANGSDIRQRYEIDKRSWALDIKALRQYVNSNSDVSDDLSVDGYGNQFAIIISVCKDHPCGLVIDTNNVNKIPTDFMSQLESSVGSHSGRFYPYSGGFISGLGHSWSFPATDWKVSGLSFNTSQLFYFVHDETFTESLLSSFKTMSTQGGKISTFYGEINQQLIWQPIFTDDDFYISFQKNDAVDYVDLYVDATSKERVYTGKIKIHPRADWIIHGADFELSLHAHNKFTGQSTPEYSLSVHVGKKDVKDYIRMIFSRIQFYYITSPVERVNGGGYKPSRCLKSSGILATKVLKVLLTNKSRMLSGYLLQPLQFQLSYNPIPSLAPVNNFFSFTSLSTSDYYQDSMGPLKKIVDISAGLCGNDEFNRSTIFLSVKDFSTNKFIKLDSKDVSRMISSPSTDSLYWQ